MWQYSVFSLRNKIKTALRSSGLCRPGGNVWVEPELQNIDSLIVSCKSFYAFAIVIVIWLFKHYNYNVLFFLTHHHMNTSCYNRTNLRSVKGVNNADKETNLN